MPDGIYPGAVLKACCRCHLPKERTSFSPDVRASDGLQSACRTCCASDRQQRDLASGRRQRSLALTFAQREEFRAIGLKWCAACESAKPTNKFYRCSTAYDGHTYECAECSRRKSDQFSKNNREKCTEMARTWRALHPAAARLRSRIGSRRDAIQNQARAKRWRMKAPELIRQRIDMARAKKPEKYSALSKASSNRRRVRVRGLPSFSHLEWLTMLEQFGSRCLCCGAVTKLTADHVMPIARGGANTIDNIQPLCLSCNLRKGTQAIDYRSVVA